MLLITLFTEHLLKLQFALLTSITGTCQKYFICLHIYCYKTYTWTGLKFSRCCQDSPAAFLGNFLSVGRLQAEDADG